MSYHIEDARGSFNEPPERILMREDGYLGAYKSHGKPIVDYWYVPMERAERLESENAKLRDERDRMYKANVEKNGEILRLLKDNAKLRELVREMWAYAEQELLCDENCSYGAVCDWRDCVFKRRMRELGVDV